MTSFYSAQPKPSALEPDEAGAHVWVALAAFRVRPTGPLGQYILDNENLGSIELGCYACEQPYTQALARTKCAATA